jgi:hypothetical protein
MTQHELSPTRLHSMDGDHEDVGYWSRGHHPEEAMRKATDETYPVDARHSCAADPTACVYFMGWWRKVPRGGGSQFYRANVGDRGAFPVTALLTANADI